MANLYIMSVSANKPGYNESSAHLFKAEKLTEHVVEGAIAEAFQGYTSEFECSKPGGKHEATTGNTMITDEEYKYRMNFCIRQIDYKEKIHSVYSYPPKLKKERL